MEKREARVRKIASFLVHELAKQPFETSGQFIYPMSELGIDHLRNLSEKIDDLDEESTEFIKYCAKLHDWIPANPSKKAVVDHLNELYVAFSEMTGDTRHLNACTDFDDGRSYNFFNYIKEPSFLLIGEKGSGKTTFLNYWFNNFTGLLDSERIIWYRVDAAKIYRTQKKKNIECSLSDYHKVHTVYVTLSYAGIAKSEQTINPIFSKIKENIESNAKKEKEGRLKNAYEKIVKEIDFLKENNLKQGENKEEREYPEYIEYPERTDTFIRSVFSDPDKFNYCTLLYQQIINYYQYNHFTLFIVVDGVDNLAWHEQATSKIYRDVCQGIADLISHIDKHQVGMNDYKLMAAIRPETEKDILDKIDTTHQKAPGKPYVIGEIKPPQISGLLHAKAAVGRLSQNSDKLQRQRNELNMKKENMQTLFGKYQDFAGNYPRVLCDYLRETYKTAENQCKRGLIKGQLKLSSTNFRNDQSLLTTCFNNNIRACAHNFNNIHSIKIYSKKIGIPNADEAERFPEYLLLNGDRFLYSPMKDKRVQGCAYYNIFWWDTTVTSNTPYVWHGLCSLRILQFLSSRHDIRKEDIPKIIGDLFGYNREIIKRARDKLIGKGFIKVGRNREGEFADFYLSTSDKGHFLMDFMFMYPDWLYFCALDTPLDKLFFASSNHVKLHRTQTDFRPLYNYRVASVPTIITFLRHVRVQHQTDMQTASSNVDQYLIDGSGKYKLFRNKKTLQDIFSLPQTLDSFLYRYMKNALRGLSKSGQFDVHVKEITGYTLQSFDDDFQSKSDELFITAIKYLLEEESEISYADLSRKIGVHQPNLEAYVNGTNHYDMRKKIQISKCFGNTYYSMLSIGQRVSLEDSLNPIAQIEQIIQEKLDSHGISESEKYAILENLTKKYIKNSPET